MKALLGILLLVNAALLMWNMGQREFMHGKHAPDADFHPELMNLLPAEKSRSMAKVTIESSGAVTTTNKLESVEEPTKVSTVPSEAPENGMETKESAADEIIVADTSAESGVAETALPGEVSEGQCMFIGPYLTAIDRGRAGRQMQDMKIGFSEKQNPRGRQLGYRVYQGPFSTNDDVSRAKRRLERQGVKDLYLINEGPNTKFISLGFFSNEKSAREFMRQFTQINVVSKERLEYATHYWLSVSDLAAIEKLKEKNAMPIPSGIRKTISDCKELP